MENNRLDYIQQAKELTGSNDITVILDAAKQLEAYLNKPQSPLWVPSNPADFLAYVKIIHPLRGVIPMDAHSFQRDLCWKIFSYIHGRAPAPFIHVASRQMGMSTILAAIAVWFAQSSRHQKVVFLSNRMAECFDIGDRMKTMLDALPYTFGAAQSTKQGVKFVNGSEIIFGAAGSEKSLEAMEGAHLVIIDNAAWIPYRFDKEYEAKIDEVVKAGTRVIVNSCANVPKGIFYELWTKADPAFKASTRWDDNKLRDREWGECYKQQLGQEAFDREFNCQFISRNE